MKDPVKIARGGEVWGEFQPEHIPEFLKNGSLIPTDFFWNETAGEWQPLSKWGGGKLRDRLKGLFDAIAGQQNQNVFIVIVLALLLASWIFPPWVHYSPTGRYSIENPHGWFFIFDANQGEGSNAPIVMRVDFGRLILVDAIIVVGVALLAWITTRLRLNSAVLAWWRRLNSTNGRILLLIIVTVVVVGWRLEVAWCEAAQQAAETARKEMAQAAEKAAAQEIEKSKVKAEDLKQITFFDSAMSGTLLDASVHWIKGSLRTNLPGIIGKISLKVSFFNKSEELIDVKKLSLENISVSRDAPVGFRSPDFNVANLPEGWKWNAEIIEAHYK